MFEDASNQVDVEEPESHDEENEEEIVEVNDETEGDQAEPDFPKWLPDVLEGLGADQDDGIKYASDEELLAIKGIGKKILAEIRAIYPEESDEEDQPVMVLVRVKPAHGIRGIGGSGAEGYLELEAARRYAEDGLVEILE